MVIMRVVVIIIVVIFALLSLSLPLVRPFVSIGWTQLFCRSLECSR